MLDKVSLFLEDFFLSCQSSKLFCRRLKIASRQFKFYNLVEKTNFEIWGYLRIFLFYSIIGHSPILVAARDVFKPIGCQTLVEFHTFYPLGAAVPSSDMAQLQDEANEFAFRRFSPKIIQQGQRHP